MHSDFQECLGKSPGLMSVACSYVQLSGEIQEYPRVKVFVLHKWIFFVEEHQWDSIKELLRLDRAPQEIPHLIQQFIDVGLVGPSFDHLIALEVDRNVGGGMGVFAPTRSAVSL